jgi:hypothetical protein
MKESSAKVIYWRNKVKLMLVEYKGGKCQRCGYDKNIPSVYAFHHRNPNEKEFSISGMTKSFDNLKKEADKCDLLCSNCHLEVHHELHVKHREEHGVPHLQKLLQCENCNNKFLRNKYGQKYCSKKCFYTKNKKTCKTCNKTFVPNKNKIIFCSSECHKISTRKAVHPNKEELQNMINTMTWVAIGKKYAVSEAAIRKWAKKYNLIRHK